MEALLEDPVALITGVVIFVAAALAFCHVLVTKRDSRGAVAWAGLILFVPALGVALYYIFGINRVQRRAGRLEGLRASGDAESGDEESDTAAVRAALPEDRVYLNHIARRVDRLATRPLVAGNLIEPFDSGDAAYPAMLAAIDAAERSVALSSYIFRHDRIGDRFAQALERACDRGVAVRVLVDGVGAFADMQRIVRHLRRAGVPTQRFLYSLVPWRMPYLNMRNHAKLLIADGRVAFTGGVNIKDACLLEQSGEGGVADVHFRLQGPIVAQAMERFAADWRFTSGENLSGPAWFPTLSAAGAMLGRGIESGPDFDENPLRWTLLSAITTARRSIRIATPYFLPDETVLSALRLAAAGGVKIDVVTPETLDHKLLQWAARSEQETTLDAGARVWLSRPPFDHAKLMTVDGAWSLIGSGNWDMRSLRLNFEYVCEVYDEGFARTIDDLIDARIARSRRLDRSELSERSLPIKLRDGAAHLLQPYL
ncbi:MAG: phospholipase D-like domain-containing protein [Marivibrio sp.]|uniref:phospholipase D-like domain-containing protein n=1 Tax=Marivibrio sp. TaxID=2039719 RepID=UPI0032EABC3A